MGITTRPQLYAMRAVVPILTLVCPACTAPFPPPPREVISAQTTWIHLVDGALVEEPLPIDDAIVVAAHRFDQTPTLLVATLRGGSVSGELQSVDLSAPDAPLSTDAGEFSRRSEFDLGSAAAFADLDDDGDEDAVLRLVPYSPPTLLLNVGGTFVSSDIEDVVGAGAPAAFDVGNDGRPEIIIAGLNGDQHLLRVDGGSPRVASSPFVSLEVGRDWYCLESFGVVDERLYASGSFCGTEDTTGRPDGPDRFFQLDENLTANGSVETPLDDTTRILDGAGQIFLAGRTFQENPDRDGPLSTASASSALDGAAQVLVESDPRSVGDIDGDGQRSLFVVGPAAPPEGEDIIWLAEAPRDVFGPHIIDIDGDGVDDAVITRLTYDYEVP